MSGSEPETPKPNAVDQEVTNALDNLKAENEKLVQDLEEARAQLADADRLLMRKNQEIQAMGGVLAVANQQAEDVQLQLTELETELAAVTADRDELQRQLAELATVQTERNELRSQLDTVEAEKKAIQKDLTITNRQYVRGIQEVFQLKKELAQLQKEAKEAADPGQQPAPAIELPDAADTLEEVRKALGKKSTASLADVKKILEIIEGQQ